MGIDSTELETLRDALLRARAKGTRSVVFADGRRVDYASDSEMASALADLERRIVFATRRIGAMRFTSSKGF